MATPTFTGLPNEILDQIISDTLPEGFESLALTSKTFHKLCQRYIKHHNYLRKHFTHFEYRNPEVGRIESFRRAVDLIERISIEPVVARYIIHADFIWDSFPSLQGPQYLPPPNFDGSMNTLFAKSPYLEQAGLDWKEYYAVIRKDIEADRWRFFSLNAAAFVLTLLPNVKTLMLPRPWMDRKQFTEQKQIDEADKLIAVIFRKSQQMNSYWNKLMIQGR